MGAAVGVLVVLLLLVAGVATRIRQRAIGAEQEATQLRTRFAGVLEPEREAAAAQQSLRQVLLELSGARQHVQTLNATLAQLRERVALLEEHTDLLDLGVYKPHFNLDSSEAYRQRLTQLNERIREVVKSGRATHCPTTWSIGGSEKEGAKMIKSSSALMLRAFNGECDAAIAKVNWSNVQQMEARIRASCESINKAGLTLQIYITEEYYRLRLQELWLEHEMENKKQQEKEEQRAIREQMKEEEKAQREAERERKRAEEDEQRSRDALEAARRELARAHGDREASLRTEIARIEAALAQAMSRKQRATSLAEQTKVGNIYVISNIGSFGENVFKIGMTRRLDPLERVKELGDASVPFEFDVHAIIPTNDAPAMETRFHQVFNQRRLNLVNQRREFFRVTLDEIAREASRMGVDIQFTQLAQAREYRESESIRASQGEGHNLPPRQTPIAAAIPAPAIPAAAPAIPPTATAGPPPEPGKRPTSTSASSVKVDPRYL